MNKFLTNTFFAIAVLLILSFSAQAQHGYRLEKSLKFAAGKSSAIAKGRIGSAQETHEYKFTAQENQTVEIRVTSRNPDMTFLVTDPTDEKIGDAAKKTHAWKATLNAAGEYKILVYPLDGRGNYTLSVSIK